MEFTPLYKSTRLERKIKEFLKDTGYDLIGGSLCKDKTLYVNIEAHNGAMIPGEFGKKMKEHLGKGIGGLVLNSRIID